MNSDKLKPVFVNNGGFRFDLSKVPLEENLRITATLERGTDVYKFNPCNSKEARQCSRCLGRSFCSFDGKTGIIPLNKANSTCVKDFTRLQPQTKIILH